MKRSILVAVAACSLLCACGNPAQNFIGTYSVGGTATLTFPTENGPYTSTSQLSGNYDFREGINSDLVLAIGSCLVPFNADDWQSARVVSGSSCTDNDGTTSVALNFNGGTATLSGKIVTVSLQAALMVTSGGFSYPGTATYSMNLSKMTK